MIAARRALAFVCCTAMLCAQGSFTFEVAAIKPGETDDRVGSGVLARPTGEFQIHNLTVESMVVVAYGLKPYQVTSGPAWARTERFTIVAKAPGEGPFKPTDHYALLQALLAERFHLKIRREMTDLPSYALMVDKGGPKMQRSGPEEKYSESSGSTAGPPRTQGGGSVSELTYTAATMDAFVSRLGFWLRNSDVMPVLNRTGLEGAYNFSLPRALEMLGGANGPSIFSAIKDLGLKLEKGKFPVETIVIESVERPMFD